MNHDFGRIRWLHIGILLVFVLAALSRLAGLEQRALGNEEASQALNAAQLTSDPAPYWSSNREALTASPLYEWSTGLVFQFAGSGNGQARFVPAIAGMLLALLPLFFLGRMSNFRLLISSVFLALSPVAITLARSADGTSLSALFLAGSLLAAVLPSKDPASESKWIWSAVLLGAGIASGAAIYQGLFALGISILLLRWLKPSTFRSAPIRESVQSLTRYLWLTPVVAILLATGAGGFGFGLAGLGEAIIIWLQGWVPFGELSALTFLVAGLTYEPFLFVVGILAAVLAWRQRKEGTTVFAIWMLGSLLAGLIYPGRSAQDWIWVVIPLSFLAADLVEALLVRLTHMEDWLQLAALVSIALVLISAAIVTLLGYVNGYLQQMLIGDEALITLALVSMLLLLISVFALFGVGWSWDVVLDGTGIVIIIVTSLLSISAGWSLANDTGLSFRTLWESSSPTENGIYLKRTLENASLALTGDDVAAPVFVQGELDPSMVWLLRDYPAFKPVDSESLTAPPILIVREGAGIAAYTAEYFGQNFAMTLERGWFGMLPPNLLRWSLDHSAPTASTGWVLFVRSDIIALSEFSSETPLE